MLAKRLVRFLGVACLLGLSAHGLGQWHPAEIVPRQHWAYQLRDEFAKLPRFGGSFPSHFYVGRLFTRFEFAVTTKRLNDTLNRMDALNRREHPTMKVSAFRLRLRKDINKLRHEFRREIQAIS